MANRKKAVILMTSLLLIYYSSSVYSKAFGSVPNALNTIAIMETFMRLAGSKYLR